MALSYKSVEKAKIVFEALRESVLPELNTWQIEDMGEWSEEKQKNPPLNQVLGWGRKADDGFESISFFTEEPSEEIKEAFLDLRKEARIPNSYFIEPYFRNENIWVIGWY